MKKTMILLSACFFSLPACKSTVEDASSKDTESNIETTEADGVVTGEVNPKATAVLVSSKKSKVSGSYTEVAAGTLDVATDVSIGEGDQDAETLLAILSVDPSKNKAAKETASLFVGPGVDTALNKPLTIAIPLPVDDGGLSLMAPASGRLVMLYLIYTEDGYRAGIKVLDDSDFAGTFVKTTFDGFGIYIIVYLAVKVQEQEIAVSTRPALKN